MPDYTITFYAGGLAHSVDIEAPSLEDAEAVAQLALEQPYMDFATTHKWVRIFTAQVGAFVVQPTVEKSATPQWKPSTARVKRVGGGRSRGR